jgi:hypothetical protein
MMKTIFGFGSMFSAATAQPDIKKKQDIKLTYDTDFIFPLMIFEPLFLNDCDMSDRQH